MLHNHHLEPSPSTIIVDKFFYFSVLEVPRDSGNLKQYEINLIKVCGEKGLFIPPHVIKVSEYDTQ